jgi:parallel beta-helix repeat protein
VGVCGWDGSHVINNRIHHNGQMGLCGQGADIVVENNEVDHNNTQGHHYGWEAGGSKWVKTTNLIVRGNYSHHNYGIGFWTDINNVHTLYENNVISDNDAIGIFHEVSYDAVIRNNVIRDNGFGVDWSVDGSGIKVSSSPDVEIYGNTIADNAGGVMLTQYERSDTSIPTGFAPHLNRNNYVHDNTFVLSHGRVGAMVASSSADSHICDAASNNRYRRNTYTLPTSSTTAFLWCGNPITQSAWRQLSMDQP